MSKAPSCLGNNNYYDMFDPLDTSCRECDYRLICEKKIADKGGFVQEETKQGDKQMSQGEVLEGFVQVTTKLGMFMCKKVELTEHFVKLHGPLIVSMQIQEDPKTKQLQTLQNTDKAEYRFLNSNFVVSVDVLNPITLTKNLKEVYESLTGITLV